MDKGAHFYKSDFQVHTPRDAQWGGGEAVTDAERKTYAEELIQACREKRQLVFASHSANFVVNGDAELVVCCDYVKAGDQTRGTVKDVGAIDKQAIKEEITLVTEGGKDAFKLRKEKYGF